MEKFLKPISKNCTKIIFEQMDSSICKIDVKIENFVLGFFCYIKIENKKIPVLITDLKIIDNISENKINIFMNNQNKEIELGDIIFKNIINDIAIIEIKENMTKNINLLDLDERLYKNNIELNSGEGEIYAISYDNENKNISVSYGNINNINNSEIRYSCQINSQIRICPIFNLSNNKIIGIHQKCSIYYNKGLFLNNIINKFIKFYKIKKNKKLRILKSKN